MPQYNILRNPFPLQTLSTIFIAMFNQASATIDLVTGVLSIVRGDGLSKLVVSTLVFFRTAKGEGTCPFGGSIPDFLPLIEVCGPIPDNVRVLALVRLIPFVTEKLESEIN